MAISLRCCTNHMIYWTSWLGLMSTSTFIYGVAFWDMLQCFSSEQIKLTFLLVNSRYYTKIIVFVNSLYKYMLKSSLTLNCSCFVCLLYYCTLQIYHWKFRTNTLFPGVLLSLWKHEFNTIFPVFHLVSGKHYTNTILHGASLCLGKTLL